MTATRSVGTIESRPSGGGAPVTVREPERPKPTPNRGWWIVAALVLGYVIQVAWRLWLARTVWTPVAHGD